MGMWHWRFFYPARQLTSSAHSTGLAKAMVYHTVPYFKFFYTASPLRRPTVLCSISVESLALSSAAYLRTNSDPCFVSYSLNS